MSGLLTAGLNPSDDKVYLYTSSFDLSKWGWLERGSVKDMMKFFCRNSMKSLKKGQRYTIAHEGGHNVHAIVSDKDYFAVFAFTDMDYPRRVAYKCLEDAFEAFQNGHGDKWKAKKDDKMELNAFNAVFEKYKVASKVDKLTLATMKVDETKAVLVDNMKTLLEREEKLDDMVQKSDDLSLKTKTFYKNAQKMNSKCCTLI